MERDSQNFSNCTPLPDHRPILAAATTQPALRFPRPDGSWELASWVSRRAPKTMRVEERTYLSDSAYELVQTDEDSQDGQCSESLCSLEYAQPEDVRSIIGTDPSYDDEPEQNKQTEPPATQQDGSCREVPVRIKSPAQSSSRHSQAIDYAREALDTPSPKVGSIVDPGSQPFAFTRQSIEFEEEDGTVAPDGISVRHMCRVFSEGDSRRIADIHGVENCQLGAVMRQTMSRHYLFITGPLRILYVGSDAAHRDIIYKISSALAASTGTENIPELSSYEPSDGLYQVVPISAFGSQKIPEIELLESSAIQIKVETCTSASYRTKAPGHSKNEGEYCLNLHKDRLIQLSACPKSQVRTHWEVPHLAVFYCTENDEDDIKKTCDAAWRAMISHAVPCLFIIHDLEYDNPPKGPWRDYLNPDTLHISLEPLDLGSPMAPVRLPVDLSSFLALDARQLNRHLAYVTSLVGGPKVRRSSDKPVHTRAGRSLKSFPNQFGSGLGIYKLVISMFLLLIGCAAISYSILSFPLGSAVKDGNSAITGLSTTTATVTVRHTSTRTIAISKSESTAVSWFFDSMLWPAPDRPLFTARKSSNAVFLTIDAAYSYLASPDRLQIAVYRGLQSVEAQVTLYRGQAVLVELERQDAYGMLTIRLETSHKPRIKEAHSIEFGRPLGPFEAPFSYAQSFAMKLAVSANETANVIPLNYHLGRKALSGTVLYQAVFKSSAFLRSLEEAGNYTAELTRKTGHQAKMALSEARQKVQGHLQMLTHTQIKAKNTIQHAQISARLWWLKVQGQLQDYDVYKRKAVQYLTGKAIDVDHSGNGNHLLRKYRVMAYLIERWY